MSTLQTHEMRRVRRDVVMRLLEVKRVETLTPHMVRITLTGDALAGFESGAPDDHVKVFVPPPGHTHPTLPVMTADGPRFAQGVTPSAARDYTPRRYDAAANELDIDFVLHGDGPASTWASQAKPGQWLGVGGPRGSRIVADDFDTYVLIGDETALPAIGRWLDEMPAGTRAITIVEVANEDERQPLHSKADVQRIWLYRNGEEPGMTTRLEDALRAVEFPEGDTFVWVGAESRTVRGIRLYLQDERNHNPDWIKASGYWKRWPDDEDA
ncbi:siderophore-interacting protein [Pararobbsia silviterrae]|uniref:Siderophore-interacting protein n=1 Tax=Pararobbsia silviterrae TaxID=1792498 RepID=A0A494Y5R8_9BURK|nr:siderophore-interacting protein [Pararobbsia silviterrae]RKP55666.1 siderophore-interacting protein [Pararobbsia silviterrae]